MTDTCKTCGHPRDHHPYRHPFVGVTKGVAPTVSAEAHLETALITTFDEVYNAEWDRVAESEEGSSASGVADRAATIAGIRAVHGALLARLSELDAALTELASPEFMRNYAAMKVKLKAADKLAQSVAWHLFGQCRGFDDGQILSLPEALANFRNPAPAAEGE